MNKTLLTLLACLSLSACCGASQDHATYTHTEHTVPAQTVVMENSTTSEHKTGDAARMEMERMDAEHAMSHGM